MLPRRDAFLAGLQLFVRRRHPRPVAFDAPALAAALAHAGALAAGDKRSEPAALFFACALRSRAFGAASHDLVPILARNQALGLGFRLNVTDVELAILHARILVDAITFEEVQRTFAAALRPAGEDPGTLPPRRPG
jgi:hypothetical protein